VDKLTEALREQIGEAVSEWIENNTLEVDAGNVDGLDEAIERILNEFDMTEASGFTRAVESVIEDYEISVKASNVDGLDEEITEGIERYLREEDLGIEAGEVKGLPQTIREEVGRFLREEKIEIRADQVTGLDPLVEEIAADEAAVAVRDLLKGNALTGAVREYLTTTAEGQGLLASAVRAEIRRLLLSPWVALKGAWGRVAAWWG
jgi:hypothetical protein